MKTEDIISEYSSVEEAIKRLRNGEIELRDQIIKQNWRFIQAIVSKMTKRPADSTEEFSVALEAFNEAIDYYDTKKDVKFLSFAGLVINRRVIDHIRKNSRFNGEYPFTYFETEDNENYMENYILSKPDVFTEKIEIEEEILKFKRNLLEYDISFPELTKISPKHRDTKILCIKIANLIKDNKDLSKKLIDTKRLPIASILLREVSISRKTLEKHRKYIIALYLIINSELEVIKSYTTFLMKGVD